MATAHSIDTSSKRQTAKARKLTPRGCLFRIAGVGFGLILALLITEIGLRLVYHSLPETLQIALRDVQITPFTDARLVPPPIWQPADYYQTITTPGLNNVLAYSSPDVSFHVTTYSWWNGSVGFRSAQPTDGHEDAVAVGDSFTFCFTEAADCWVTYVASHSGLSVANLGQPVTGSMSHARIFKTFALPIKPPLVIWQFYGNDFNDDYGLAQLDGTAKTLPAPAPPPLPDSPVANWLRHNSTVYTLLSALIRRGQNQGVEQFVDPYHVTQGNLDLWFGQSYLRDALDMTNPRNLEGETDSQQALLDTQKLVQSYGGHLLILLFPTKEEVYQALTAPLMGQSAIDALGEPYQRLLTFCQAQNLTCVDLFPDLRAAANDGIQLYYPRDLHLNPKGNEVVGTAVVRYLKNQGWAR